MTEELIWFLEKLVCIVLQQGILSLGLYPKEMVKSTHGSLSLTMPRTDKKAAPRLSSLLAAERFLMK